ncbi:MAG: hypothetical protein ACP5OA_03025 [Candidatus Woesearchaeota archaeon]
MKKLVTIIGLLIFATTPYIYGENKSYECQFFTAQANIKGDNLEEESYFSLEVSPNYGLKKENALVKENDSSNFDKKPLFPVFFGVSEEQAWNFNNEPIWQSDPLDFMIGQKISYPVAEDILPVKLKDNIDVPCSSYRDGKALKIPANNAQKLMFLMSTSFIYNSGLPVTSLTFDLYLNLKREEGKKIFICHLAMSFFYENSVDGKEKTWFIYDIRYWDVNNDFLLRCDKLPDGKSELVVIPKISLTKKFYNCDFFIMFPNVTNPFLDVDIRPVGKVLENNFHFYSKDVKLCNVYASSESSLPYFWYNTPEDLLSSFNKQEHSKLPPMVDISVYNTPFFTDVDRKNMNICEGSILLANAFSGNKNMYSWDECKGTLLPSDVEAHNYKLVHLFAYADMPEIPPRLDYDIIHKTNGKTGHIRLYFKMVPGVEGSRWWLDRVEGDYDGRSARIAGGPGFLGIAGNPWVLSFNY